MSKVSVLKKIEMIDRLDQETQHTLHNFLTLEPGQKVEKYRDMLEKLTEAKRIIVEVYNIYPAHNQHLHWAIVHLDGRMMQIVELIEKTNKYDTAN